MNADPSLQQRLLQVMDRKHHWAFPFLTKPGLSRAQLLVHFQQEYGVYVRDFPVLLARALGQVPDRPDVRRALAENLYEEQTGGLSGSGPHPELFLVMMEGLGFARGDFQEESLSLLPAAASYRELLLQVSAAPPWQVAVALLTVFVEGSVNERAELAGTFRRKVGEEAVRSHALVVHYGCPPEAMRLTRAHGDIEGSHRKDAWRILLSHAGGYEDRIVRTCEDALARWLLYRDAVAAAMGLERGTLRIKSGP